LEAELVVVALKNALMLLYWLPIPTYSPAGFWWGVGMVRDGETLTTHQRGSPNPHPPDPLVFAQGCPHAPLSKQASVYPNRSFNSTTAPSAAASLKWFRKSFNAGYFTTPISLYIREGF
jgi:hypothetical protein